MIELLQTRALFAVNASGQLAAVDFTTTGDKAFIEYPKPIRVYRWGFLSGVTFTHAATSTLTLELRPVLGSDTNRAVQDTMALGAAGQDLAAGQGNFNTLILPGTLNAVQSDGSLLNVGGSGPLVVVPGNQLVFKINVAGAAAGNAEWPFIEFVELPYAVDIKASAVPALCTGLYTTMLKRQS